MEAESRALADQMMQQLKDMSTVNFSAKDLEDVRVETPIFGISKRKRNGIELVWVGKEFTSNGWLAQDEYDKIQKLKNEKRTN
jgi:hypothetical protein